MKKPRARPVAIERAPLCQSMLRQHWPPIRPPYEGYDDWLLAEAIADQMSEKRLKAAGINFWTMNGAELIDKLEEMLTGRQQK